MCFLALIYLCLDIHNDIFNSKISKLSYKFCPEALKSLKCYAEMHARLPGYVFFSISQYFINISVT